MRRGFPRSVGHELWRALAWAALALVLSLGLARLHDYRGWDQSFYLAQTSSLVEDGDVDLRNDLLHLQREPTRLLSLLTKLRGTGHLDNAFAIGTSVLWVPVYTVTKELSSIVDGPQVRWAPLQLVALQLVALAAVIWLLWALDRWLRRIGLPRWLAALVALTLVLGTPLAFYGLRAYTYSHLASVVAVLWLLLAAMRLGDRPTIFWALLVGVALGIAFLCRWQNLAKGLVLLAPVLQLRSSRLPAGRWLRLAASAAVGALAVAGLQLHAWFLDRGELFTLPQGSGFIDLTSPEIGRFLFSGLSGLLPWSPVFALGLLGLLLPWRLRLSPVWRWIVLGVLAFDVLLNASVGDWWAGTTYGSRRMIADVPLLAVGVANLAVQRRLRPAVVAALALCCLWGTVTANLRLHGLRDLGILVLGRPSVAADPESAAQPSAAEARQLLLSWPLGKPRMTYFAGTRPHGRLLTVAIGGFVAALVGWGLARPRAPAGLAPVLLAVLGLVAYAHLRLLTGGGSDPQERRSWVELARDARGRPASESGIAAGERPDALGLDDEHADARRFLWAFALAHRGQRDEAQELAAELARRPYPVAPDLLDLLARQTGEQVLLRRRGFFFAARAERPARQYDLSRKLSLRCHLISLVMAVEYRPQAPPVRGPLFSWGRRGEPPLVRVEVAEDLVALVTAEARTERVVRWRSGAPFRLAMDWDCEAERVALTVAGGQREPVALAAPLARPPSGPGRFSLAIGTPGFEEWPWPPQWRIRYSDLEMAVRNVCQDRPPQ